MAYNFIKNKTSTQMFSFEFCQIFKNTFEQLLLCTFSSFK